MVEKIGPYRVYERLGVGGMGEVYKAYDDKLERWVAIKRIRPDREDAEDNRERFKREARATARLNHPSIVHLYGIFQDGDSDCIVMEYVEGETLDKKLVRGTLGPLQVATLGHEIASGLAEAHANGILHRDLKAENIIITPKGRSKILDFGLAKPILSGELDPVLTGKGQLVGTSRAMSPEYVGGEAIDHRSDLFSLGVLLYECLTGQSPFKAHNTLATLKQVMLHKQTPIREINPDVPKELSDTIDQLLEKEPENRPQNAQDVAHTFATLSGQFSSNGFDRPSGATLLDSTASRLKSTAGKAFSSSETMLDLRPRRRWMTGLAVIVALLVVAFFLGRILDDDPDVTPLPEGERIRVVLGDFVNRTNESVFDGSLQQAMRVDLEQSRSVETLSPSSIRDTLSRMEKSPDLAITRDVAVEIARREGAHRVVLGEIQEFGGNYSLLIQIVAPENDVATFSASESAKSHEGILSAMQKLTTAVRSHLGESADQISESSMALEKVTTANFEALRAYTLGEQRMSLQQFDEAIPLLRRAIELDASFAMAHAKLVAAYSNLGDTESASRAALEAQRNSGRLTELERFYVDGWVARWLETPADVIEVWSLFRDLYPEEYAGHSNLALSYWYYLNDFDSAARSASRAVQTARAPRERSQAHAVLGFCRLAAGDYAEAERLFKEVAEPGRSEGLALLNAIRGRFDVATQYVESLDEEDVRGRMQHAVLASRGSFREALQSVQALNSRWEVDDGKSPNQRLYSLVTEVALAAQVDDQRALSDGIDRLVQLARGTDPYSRNLPEATASVIASSIKVVSRSGYSAKASVLRDLLRGPPPHTPAIALSLIEIADAELAIGNGDFESAVSKLNSSLSRVSTVTGHETLGFLLASQKDYPRALEEYRWVQRNPGLAYVECYQSCASVTSQAILWTLSLFHAGRLSAELDQQSGSESISLFVERWGDSDLPEVVISRNLFTPQAPRAN